MSGRCDEKRARQIDGARLEQQTRHQAPDDFIVTGRCICGNEVWWSGRGRPPKHCQQSCRQAAYMGRRRRVMKHGGSRHDGWTQTKINDVNQLRSMGIPDDEIARIWRCRAEDLPPLPRLGVELVPPQVLSDGNGQRDEMWLVDV